MSSTRKRLWLAVASLVLFAVVVRGFFFLEPPGRDQSLFLAQADALIQGNALYGDIWEHKPPAVIWAYAAAITVMDRSYLAIHVLDLIAGVTTAFLLLLWVRRWSQTVLPGFVAGVLYLTYRSGLLFGGYWCTGQPETLMDPLLMGAVWLLFGGRRSAFGAGACIAAVILLKYSALPMVLLGLCLVRDRPRLLSFILGGLSVALLLVVQLLAAGTFVDFWEATVQFNLVHRDVASEPLFGGLSRKVFYLAKYMVPIYVLAVAGLLLYWRGNKRLLQWGLGLWLLSLVSVFWQGKFWIYHYHVLLLPLCLLTAAGTVELQRLMSWPVGVVTALALMTTTTPYLEEVLHYEDRHHLTEFWQEEVDALTFLSSYSWGAPDYNAGETLAATRKVNRETTENDSVFVMGFEPGIYFYSQRRPATRFLYDYPLMPRFQSLHRGFMERLMSDLNADPPALFIVLQRDTNDIERLDSLAQLNQLEPLKQYLSTHYAEKWRLGDFVAYARVAESMADTR